MHLQWFLVGGSPRLTLYMKELSPRKQIGLAPTLSLGLFGDKDREKTVSLQTALIHSSDGINGLITPLLINEWEKCFQRQPTSSISPSPAVGCLSAGGTARVVQRLGAGLSITLTPWECWAFIIGYQVGSDLKACCRPTPCSGLSPSGLCAILSCR